MRFVRILFVLLVAAFAIAGTGVRADVPVPSLAARVTDETGTLTSEQRSSLEQTLEDFEARKGAQISVLIVPTTQPETIEQYSMRVVEQWKLGRQKVDDGALLIIAKSDRSLRIEVGYGLEGALNDATSSRIIRDVIVPRFKQDDSGAPSVPRSLDCRFDIAARRLKTYLQASVFRPEDAREPPPSVCDRART